MKRVLILGATGMLGSAVYDVLKERYALVLSVRDKKKVELLEKAYGGTKNHKIVEFDVAKVSEDFLNKKGHLGPYLTGFLEEVGEVDYVINAVGVTIPFSLENPALTFFINAAFPHILAKELGPKLIHITTDCVFSGTDGYPYDENSHKTPVDIYGLSKSLGEPTACLTLRTSIIGRELEGFTGLLEWFLQQKGKNVNGFSRHFWNGITTKQFGVVCDKIMQNPEKYPRNGLFHIFSNKVSKYEMLLALNKKFNLGCDIAENSEAQLDRTMSTVKEMNSRLEIPSFDQMVQEL